MNRRWDAKDSFLAMFVVLFVIAIVLMIGSLILLVVA